MLTTFKEIKDNSENVNRELETIKIQEIRKIANLKKLKNIVTDYKLSDGGVKQLPKSPIDNKKGS